MKLLINLLLLCTLFLVPISVNAGKRIEIDKIVARINGANILQSDLNQPRIAKEGGTYTLDEAIIEELLFQRAAEMRMLPSNLDIDRHLVSFKIQNKLTDLSDKEFEDQLKQSGFTLQMYKNQLARLIAGENVKRAEISEKIVVTSQEVEEAYKKAEPTYTKEEFCLSMSTDGAKTWDDLGWIAKKDLREDFEIVLAMKKGEISKPIVTEDKSELRIKLVDKKDRHVKTVSERYGELERELQEEKKNSFVGDFETELKAKASIVNLD